MKSVVTIYAGRYCSFQAFLAYLIYLKGSKTPYLNACNSMYRISKPFSHHDPNIVIPINQIMQRTKKKGKPLCVEHGFNALVMQPL